MFRVVRLDGARGSRQRRCVVAALLRRKSPDVAVAEGASANGLRRTLGVVDLTLMGVGAIVGAGIFSSVGEMAAGTAERRAPGRRSCSRTCSRPWSAACARSATARSRPWCPPRAAPTRTRTSRSARSSRGSSAGTSSSSTPSATSTSPRAGQTTFGRSCAAPSVSTFPRGWPPTSRRSRTSQRCAPWRPCCTRRSARSSSASTCRPRSSWRP